MKRLASAWFIASLLAANPTLAEVGTYSAEYHACVARTGGDDDKRIACIETETDRQDAALNAAYARLMRRLSEFQKQRLRFSERAWLQYRDAECAFQSSINIGGPPGIVARAERDARVECILRETSLRVDALKTSYGRSWDGFS